MSAWFLLAPGPSLSEALVAQVRGRQVCAVANSYELAPWAGFLVANDRVWWNEHPEAQLFSGRKFSANHVQGVERVNPCTFMTASNSGVLALDLLRNLGATKIVMLGFDFHGTHFFGPYRNRCRNTPERRRKEHAMQFSSWASGNKVQVVNCTPGTMLEAFPKGDLAEHLNG